jgi:bile acid:Na+ symporter, BASS family
MPVTGPIPEWLLTVVAAATIFTVMLDVGLGVVLGEFRWVSRHPGLLARGLFAALIAVPALALLVCRLLGIPRPIEIGIVLMGISPGAPVALRRSLGAGGHHSFAPALQIMLALLAVVSMPLSIAALNPYYAGHASVAPWHVARQVFLAQLLPLGIGILTRKAFPAQAARLVRWLDPLGTILLIALATLAIADVWEVVLGAGTRVGLAIALITALALAVGHLMGGPDAGTRTSVAISSAARNPGLALLVATLNAADPAISVTVLVYIAISAITVIPYIMWRRQARPPADTVES